MEKSKYTHLRSFFALIISFGLCLPGSPAMALRGQQNEHRAGLESLSNRLLGGEGATSDKLPSIQAIIRQGNAVEVDGVPVEGLTPEERLSNLRLPDQIQEMKLQEGVLIITTASGAEEWRPINIAELTPGSPAETQLAAAKHVRITLKKNEYLDGLENAFVSSNVVIGRSLEFSTMGFGLLNLSDRVPGTGAEAVRWSGTLSGVVSIEVTDRETVERPVPLVSRPARPRVDAEALLKGFVQSRLQAEMFSSAAARSVGLPAETANLYRRRSPATVSLLESEYGDFIAAAEQMLETDSFHVKREKSIQDMLQKIPRIGSAGDEELRRAFRELLEFSDTADSDPDARQFVVNVARMAARRQADYLKSAGSAQTLPPHPRGRPFVDLATGINFIYFMPGLDPETEYILVDKSLYVASYLEEVAGQLGRGNVRVLRQRIQDLQFEPDSLGTVRAKNLFTYVSYEGGMLERIRSWVGQGGEIITQNDPNPLTRRLEVIPVGAFHQKLVVEKGWGFEFQLGKNHPDARKAILDTVKFINDGGRGLSAGNTLQEYTLSVSASAGLEELRAWIGETLGALRLTEEQLADLLDVTNGQTVAQIGPDFSTRAKLTRVTDDVGIADVGERSRRAVLVQRGLFSAAAEQRLDQGLLGAIQWLEPGQDPLLQLKALKTGLDSGEIKYASGDPKTVLLVGLDAAERLKQRMSELDIDSGWELPVIIVGISAGALRPANSPEVSVDPKILLAYLQRLFAWGDLLPGRVVEQLMGTFLDSQQQALFLSTAA